MMRLHFDTSSHRMPSQVGFACHRFTCRARARADTVSCRSSFIAPVLHGVEIQKKGHGVAHLFGLQLIKG